MTDKERERLTAVEARAKSNTHAIEELKENYKEILQEQKAIHRINTNIELIAQSVATVKEDVSDMKNDISKTNKEVKDDIDSVKTKISDIENSRDKETASTFRKYKDNIIGLIVGGIAAFVLATVCPEIFG